MPARPPNDPVPRRVDRADLRGAEERRAQPWRVTQDARRVLRRHLIDRDKSGAHRNNRDSLDTPEPRFGARTRNPIRPLLSHGALSADRANDRAPAPARGGARGPAT